MVCTILEASFTDDQTIHYIPLLLKYENPTLHGQILCHQNQFLDHHRNIAIAGISLIAMDHRNTNLPETESPPFWHKFMELPGVIRVDSSKRTYNLGKWNISTTDADYEALTKTIDENLQQMFEALPLDVKNTSSYTEFPIPRRLTKTASSTTGTKNSRKTSSSAYASHLATRWGNTPKVAVVTLQAWRPPPQTIDISYDLTETKFPTMQKKLSEAGTHSTAPLTKVSSISKQFLMDAIASETAKIKQETKARDDKMDLRMKHLDDQISSLTKSLIADS
jgi:hypothetical protein